MLKSYSILIFFDKIDYLNFLSTKELFNNGHILVKMYLKNFILRRSAVGDVVYLSEDLKSVGECFTGFDNSNKIVYNF